jgi:acyl carrier protein
MTDADLRDRLTSVFRDVFDNPSIAIFDRMTAADVDGWDSLTHVTLIVATEKAFDVKFSTRDIQSLQNVGGFVALIRKKLPA